MTIEITQESGPTKISIFDKEAAIFLTADAIDDIAKAIAEQASEEAPMGETGELKAHPVDIRHIGLGREGTFGLFSGETVTAFPSFGGGLTVRGPGGRFVKGGVTGFAPGTRGRTSIPGGDFEKVTITVAHFPRHAKWVHDGTGIYGKFHKPILPHAPHKFLKFDYKGKSWRLPSVKGQKPNPYLERAFVIINRTYIPARVEKLRLEIKEVT